MAGIAVAATGTQIKIGDGGGTEVFTTIAEVGDISGPGFTVETVDVTAHDGNGWTQNIPTLKSIGEVSFPINFNNHVTQLQLQTDFQNRTRRNFQVIVPTTIPKTYLIPAFVTSFEFSEPVNGALTVDVTLSGTDAPGFPA